MRKLLVLAVLFSVFSVPTSLFAADIGPYVGIGGSYAQENFDIDYSDFEPMDVHFDCDNAWGLNLKAGYHINRLLSLEFDLDFFSDFDIHGSAVYLGVPVDLKGKVDITTYMLVGKFSPDLGSETIRPFAAAGFGIMHGEIDARASALGVSASDSNSETDMCTKLGLGVDFFLNQKVSIGLEGAYVWGLGDMDEIRYLHYTLGVAYHF